MKSRFYNIAYIAPKVYYSAMTDLVSGIREEAKRLNINIFHFVGPSTGWSRTVINQSKFIYNLINPMHLSGIISWTSQLIINDGYIFNIEKLLDHFPDIPFMSIGKEFGEYPNVLINNAQGMRQVMRHLIYDHGYRKIAYIKGPDYHPYASERFEGYKNSLIEADIPYDENLVSLPSQGQGFNREDGVAGISYLLDVKGLKPGIDFQAVSTVSDSLSLGVVNELKRRGIKVPKDVAVVGFNNKEESIAVSPSLTTVDPDFKGLGGLAVRKLFSLINGEIIENPIATSTKLIVRYSCGCPQRDFNLSFSDSARFDYNLLKKNLLTKFVEFAVLGEKIIDDDKMPVRSWIEAIYSSFMDELFHNKPDLFLDTLGDILDQVIEKKRNIFKWREIILLMRKYILMEKLPFDFKIKVDNFFYFANDFLVQKIERFYTFLKDQIQYNEFVILDLGRSIITTFEIKKLARLLVQRLPGMGFPVCYLFLINDSKDFGGTARTVFAYNKKKIFRLHSDTFLISEMIPEKYLEKDQVYYYDFLPLYFQSNILGYIVLGGEEEIYGGEVYEVMRSQISSAIQGALLIEDLKKTESELEKLLKSLELKNIELENKVQERTKDIQSVNKKLLIAYQEANSANQAKSIFLTNMSHEIRTPLNTIVGFTEILKDLDNKADINHYLDLMMIESDKLMELINQLLDLSKIESGKFELNLANFNIFDLLEKITSVFHSRAIMKGLDFHVDIDQNIPKMLKGDSLRIYQILANLIDNAVKFTKQGTVRVSINKHKESDKKIILYFKVSDTGIGIPKERQETIFDPFTQADESTTRNFGGTGLGTTISKQLVELMDGEIGLESEPEKGSVFWFRLSFEKSAADEKDTEQEITTEQGIFQFKNILLVEDYSVTRKIAVLHLNKLGCNIDLAENGKIAVDKFNEKDYDLILMDVQMPVMDGIKATKLIRNTPKGKKLPILGMTANAFENDIKQYYKAGMNDVITKPFRKSTFINKVIQWLSK